MLFFVKMKTGQARKIKHQTFSSLQDLSLKNHQMKGLFHQNLILKGYLKVLSFWNSLVESLLLPKIVTRYLTHETSYYDPVRIIHLLNCMRQKLANVFKLLYFICYCFAETPKVKVRVEFAVALAGTCKDMCPEKERYMREVQRRLDTYECLAFKVCLQMFNHI